MEIKFSCWGKNIVEKIKWSEIKLQWCKPEKQQIFNIDVASLIIGIGLFSRIPVGAKNLTLVPSKTTEMKRKIRRKKSWAPAGKLSCK